MPVILYFEVTLQPSSVPDIPPEPQRRSPQLPLWLTQYPVRSTYQKFITLHPSSSFLQKIFEQVGYTNALKNTISGTTLSK
jgi:hypothetical protein